MIKSAIAHSTKEVGLSAAEEGIDTHQRAAHGTITKVDLSEAVYRCVGLSRRESAILVQSVLDELADALIKGESVNLSSFGRFLVRAKSERIGRNPRPGIEVPIIQRRVMVFKSSNVLKARINSQDYAYAEDRSESVRGAPLAHVSGVSRIDEEVLCVKTFETAVDRLGCIAEELDRLAQSVTSAVAAIGAQGDRIDRLQADNRALLDDLQNGKW